jgi:hypothetical protein
VHFRIRESSGLDLSLLTICRQKPDSSVKSIDLAPLLFKLPKKRQNKMQKSNQSPSN